MAETNSMDTFDFQQENDFEKISAPGSGSDQEGDGLQPPTDEPLLSPLKDSKPQDGEVSTTTETNSGEDDEAEEDQFNIIGASEVEGSPYSQAPLISLDPQSGKSDPISPHSADLVDFDCAPESESEVAAEVVAEPQQPEADPSISSSSAGSDEPQLLSSADIQPQLLDLISEAVDQPAFTNESESVPHLDLVSEAESLLPNLSSEAEPVVAVPQNLAEEPMFLQDEGAGEGMGIANEVSDATPTSTFVEPSAPPVPEVESKPSYEPLVEFDSSSGPGLASVDVEEPSGSPSPSVEPSDSIDLELEQSGSVNVEPSGLVDVEPSGSVDIAPSVSANVEPSVSANVEPSISAPPPFVITESIPSDSGDQNKFDSEKDNVNVKEVPTVSEQSRSLAEENNQEGCWLKGVDPRVSVKEDEAGYCPMLVDLIYWRDVKKTGVVFGTMLTVLLCLAIFSLLSVLAYLSLALLTVSFSFVVYKKIMAAVQKSNEGHPFKCLLDMDIALKEDKLKTVIQALLNNVNTTLIELRRLFFIEDIIDSIKFGLMLWVSTYLGCLLNGITLVILAVIMLFSLPKVYETYQVQIDNNVGLVKAQLNSVITTVQNKLPFLKKKEKAQ